MSVRLTAAMCLLAGAALAGCSSAGDQDATSASPSVSSPAASAASGAPASPSSGTATPTAADSAPRSSRPPAAPSAGATASTGSTPGPETGVAAPTPTQTQTPTQTPQAGFPSVGAAVGALLQANGVEYIGPCEQAEPADVGKYCSAVVEDRGDEVVVSVGQVFSEFDSYLLVRLGAGGWLVVKSADYPYPDDGPPPF